LALNPAEGLLNALVDDLKQRGAINDPGWEAAFRRVPRHAFVREYSVRDDDGRGEWFTQLDPSADHDAWLRMAYTDVVLVTRLAGRVPLSSSSMPSVMACFLELLDVRDDVTVLEIGTGTGYNAALLCERLGSDRVTTVDIDEACVGTARIALAACGYQPTLAVADGAAGYPSAAPYDRIIATCSVPRVPAAWIDQLGPAGVIVAPLASPLTFGLVALRAGPDGSLQGRLHAGGAAFMDLRSDAGAYPTDPEWSDLFLIAYESEGDGCQTATVPSELDSPGFRLFVNLAMPDLLWLPTLGPAVVSRRDRSWARIRHDDGAIGLCQGGPRRLWDLILAGHELWHGLGAPAMDRYGITVSDGHQEAWLDSPDSDHRWEL
jgi:protein-L-isoaspartate O-methyltransferase